MYWKIFVTADKKNVTVPIKNKSSLFADLLKRNFVALRCYCFLKTFCAIRSFHEQGDCTFILLAIFRLITIESNLYSISTWTIHYLRLFTLCLFHQQMNWDKRIAQFYWNQIIGSIVVGPNNENQNRCKLPGSTRRRLLQLLIQRVNATEKVCR